MSTKGRVAGKATIVTGAASGIGRATAEVLAREGASVSIADVDEARGRQVAGEIRADGRPGDIPGCQIRDPRHAQETGGGVIVNTGSVHSLVSLPTCTAYDAAKAGVLGLTRTLAIDYGPDIRVCAVLPGAILTPAWDGAPRERRVRYAQMVPAKRLGTAEDVANAVLFLASDEASFITGTALTVDGGMLARTE